MKHLAKEIVDQLNEYARKGDLLEQVVYTAPNGIAYKPFVNYDDRAALGLETQMTLNGWQLFIKQAEADPNGKSAHEAGSKLDAGKDRPALVLGEFPRALAEVVKIGTFGAKKYTPRGWLTVPNGRERYADAAWRHQLEVWRGRTWDTDNGLQDGPTKEKGGTGGRHKAQVIWNLLAELELELRDGE